MEVLEQRVKELSQRPVDPVPAETGQRLNELEQTMEDLSQRVEKPPQLLTSGVENSFQSDLVVEESALRPPSQTASEADKDFSSDGDKSLGSESTTTNVENSSDELSELDLAFEQYKIWSLGHRKSSLQIQFAKDNILFLVVLGVVGFGLYLSYIQFKKGDKIEGSLKLGTAGVEVTSSILGILILTFSIGFLYLYLAHVFPIKEVGREIRLPEVNSSRRVPKTVGKTRNS
ncbi:MAG: hypothetical protein AAF050_15155 [Cyanobacteria bacterium J06649_5]